MSRRALTFGFGGYADLDLTFGEFFHADHTVMLRFMPQHPYSGPGPMLAEASGTGTYMIGMGGHREGLKGLDNLVVGPSTLLLRAGNARALYRVPDFENKVGGPVGYRNVWQHLAVVRKGTKLKLYLNGKHLTPIDETEITVPSGGLPTNSTKLRIGRRSAGGVNPDDYSHTFWQFYGLIDDLAVYSRALSAAEILQAVKATPDGTENGLIAGWIFDQTFLEPKLKRPVTLAKATDIPQHVNPHAANPVPVYYVEVSQNHDSAQDRLKMDQRPTKGLATLPFCAGEWWKVSQGQESPTWNVAEGDGDPPSHNGHEKGAGFSYDLVRVNGEVVEARVIAVAAGRVIYVKESEEDGRSNAMVVYLAPSERAVYMHIQKGSFSKYFPNLTALPQDLAPANQPIFAQGDPLCDVGRWIEKPGNEHLHFSLSAIIGETWNNADNALPGVPNQISNYYVSSNKGKTWKKVARGNPLQGEWVSRYPWSPWGEKGDSLTVAPAVASQQIPKPMNAIVQIPHSLDVFVQGENNHLWQKTWKADKWSVWADLGGGRLTSAPAVVSWGPNRIDVFVRGHENQLAHKIWNGKVWSGWENLGGRLTSAPAVASWGPGRLDVFVRGHDGQLAHKRWNGKEWSDWRNLGGRLTSAPAAVSWGPNRIDVFVRGHENQLAQMRWTDDKGWSEWRNLGGRLTSAPAVASWGQNRLDVFVRGHEGQLAQMRWNGEEWSEWRDLGGRLTSAPAAVSWGPNRIDVFVRGHDFQLAQKRWTDDKGWSEWRDLDQD